MWILSAVLTAIFCVIIGFLAERRGYSAFIWALTGITWISGIIGILVLLFFLPANKPDAPTEKDQTKVLGNFLGGCLAALAILGAVIAIAYFMVVSARPLVAARAGKKPAKPSPSALHPTIEDRNGVLLSSPSTLFPKGSFAAHILMDLDMEHRRQERGETKIRLTLDARLQEAAEAALSKVGHPGAAVVLDVRNGEVLAMASQPAFVAGPLTKALWEQLTADTNYPLANRVVEGGYSPGSTFIVPVALIALGERTITPQTTVDCKGSFDFKGIKFRCWKEGGHGRVNLRDAIKNSCNVFFYNVGNKIGSERLCAALSDLDFGRKTGIDLPDERAGLVPSNEWIKKATKGQQEKMAEGEAINAAIGQGAVQVTPLQMASFYAAVANGGDLYRPNLILLQEERSKPPKKSSTHVRKHFEWAPEDRQLIVEALEEVIKSGTGQKAQIEGVRVAGKTGSAQFKGIDKSTKQVVRKTRTWFVGFAPADQPRVVVAVLVEGGESGGSTAAPVFREIMQAALALE